MAGGTMSGSTTYDAGAQGGTGDVKGHESDQVVAGKVEKMTKRSLTISSQDGQQKRLRLSEATLFEIDGREVKATEIKEGQEVRASFNQVQGRDFAVKVQASGSSMSGSSTGSVGSDASSSDISGKKEAGEQTTSEPRTPQENTTKGTPTREESSTTR